VHTDGSTIARNPTRPSRGTATPGKSFVTGATQFAERYGQGVHGRVGDVRGRSRTLSPRDLLAPVR